MPAKKNTSKKSIPQLPKKNGRSKGISTTTQKVSKHLNTIQKVSKQKSEDQNLRTVTPSGNREQSFFELVYEVARQIPYGRVTSYGAIAACLGTKLSARMVGWAMNGADKVNPTVPAHRVVNRVGLLSGKHHFKPPEKMEKLLRKEGILVKDDVIVNFKELFWNPLEEGF